MRARRLLPLCAVLTALASPAAGVGFDLTSQTRDVGVTITVKTLFCLPPPTGCSVLSTTNYSDSESAPDFSPFAATAIVSPLATPFSTQDSSLSASSLVAQGDGAHSGSGTIAPPPTNSSTFESTSSTLHRVAFDVDDPTPYRLSGSVTATGGLSANSTTRITLETSGGEPLAEVIAATDPNCFEQSCAVVGPLPVARYGVLAPGSYVLEVEASGSASPFFFAGSFLSLTSTWAYAVRLDALQVPALGSGGHALLAGVLALAAWLTRRAR